MASLDLMSQMAGIGVCLPSDAANGIIKFPEQAI